jgi:hypothetical protein
MSNNLKQIGILNSNIAFPDIGGEINPPNTYYYANNNSWLVLALCISIGFVIVFGAFLQYYSYWQSHSFKLDKKLFFTKS